MKDRHTNTTEYSTSAFIRQHHCANHNGYD